LPVIDRVIRFIAVRNHLTADEFDDFESHARLKLLADDCAILRSFRGSGTMQGYLSITIGRLFLDYRRAMWGKWRPTTAALRRGPTAVLFERLTSRDGYTVEEAYELMVTNHRVAITHAELERLAGSLPPRYPRRFEPADLLAETSADLPPPEHGITEEQAVQHAPHVATAVRRALASLDTQDRLVIVMRYHDGYSVPRIAAALGLDVKALFRRIDGLLKRLRQHIERGGVDRATIRDILGNERAVFEFGEHLPEIAKPGPSIEFGARK
jgi:RNA polymerase sigma factor (sigma-70 family)